MNTKYFLYGFLSVFGLFSPSSLLQKNKSVNSKIASYLENVSCMFKKVFDEQSKKF